jgi:hypothetical protein
VFNDDDFDLNKYKDKVPDGIIDGELFILAMKAVTYSLEEFDMTYEEERIAALMIIVNESTRYIQEDNPEVMSIIEPFLNCVIALGFHTTLLLNLLEQEREGAIKEYFSMIENEIMPDLEERTKAMPYWEE